jgi:hypothetical protein
MDVLGIDLETYSGVDLKKVGVYAYTSDPTFEILLFAYAWGDEPVQLIDLAQGEKLPTEIVDAICDETIIKTAFNAAFERTCLSKYLGRPLAPDSWRCTAVQSAMLGLPLHLAGVAKALGMEQQKMTEGKALIRYFCGPCKPTKVNGGRTRNLPSHAPEKWATFAAYCKQDVEVERAIRNKLTKFPITDAEQRLWVLDQQINDTGVLIDTKLVEMALKCDKRYKAGVTDEAKELTGLDNPNSVAQLKEWLLDNGIEVASLSKKIVKEMEGNTEGEIQRLLQLRLEMAKTSIKKYTAMQRALCPDNRVRGLLQFYGANRTGRWCLTGDHEILSSDGWVRLDAWEGGRIACWSPQTEFISFQKSQSVSFNYTGDLYAIESQRCSQLSTPDHRMAYWNKNGNWEVDTIQNLAAKRFSIPFTGRRIVNSHLDHPELRILIMTQADGHYTQDGDLRFHFSKQRKIERCKSLLRKCGLSFMVSLREKSTVISIKSRNIPLWLRTFRDKTFKMWLLDESADVIFDELELWDGYRCGPNSIQYTTTNKQNADIIQALAHLSGRAATIIKKVRNNEEWSDAYAVNIWLTPGGHNEIRKKPSRELFSGKVYCAETETGFFVVRRNGKVWITGNSGRLVQVQNLPQNHLPDLEDARDIVKTGDFDFLEMVYESVPGVLSELIRTAFIPSPGERFIVADFSAIEARVIAWLARESWRMEVFETHGKIYEASASQMFKVPLERIVKGNPEYELRQKGKIAELALGYGGSVGALTAMGALTMGVAEDELKPLVVAWRAANPKITKFWWDVDRAAIDAVTKRIPQAVGNIKFLYKSGILFITLPSGRALSYIKPKMKLNKFGREGLVYEGIGENKQWGLIDTYGPKLVENITQAVARDCLAEAMLRIDKAGYKIVMHVHDEAVITSPIGEGSLEDVCSIMGQPISWAEGLPLKADGFEAEFYKK